MTTPPLPGDEDARLRALGRYGTLETLRGQAFDDLTRLAAFICRTPIALVTLVDSTRQWFLSQYGINASDTSREVSFCVHALVSPDMLVVPDACADARFAANPLVTGDPFVRFYAGIPLVTPDGHVLGTLCVVDHVPRVLSPAERDALEALSRMAVAQMERHRLKRELHRLKYGG